MANKYVCQLRRGYKWDKDPETGEPRNDWAEYEKQGNHIKPAIGELVLEYDNGIPRLKIGNGKDEFSALPYMSVDSFILPTQATVTITPDKWMMVDCDGNIIDPNGNIVGVDGVIATQGYYEIDEDGNIIDDEEKIVKNRYIQFVKVANATITPNSKVDIQPSPSDIVAFSEKDVTFTAINAGGHIRVCVVGQKPTNQYTFNVTVTEVV